MITPQMLKELRDDINAALAPVGIKYKVALSAGHASYTDLSAHFKLEVSTIADSGEIITKEKANLRSMLSQLGLTHDHLSQVFKIGSHSYTLTGFKNTGGGKPFIITRMDNGRDYVVTRKQVKVALGIKLEAWEEQT